jgi:DNA-binding NarL/FixJ family response regulator
VNKDEQRFVEKFSYTELRVLSGVVAGQTNFEIAKETGFSETHVSTCFSRCRDKMGVLNRVEAALYIARHPGIEAALKRLCDLGMTEAERQLFASLNRKQRRVLFELMAGDRNQDIAKRLRTTEQCIKNAFRQIFDKTGMGNRLELALFMVNHPNLMKAIEAVTSGGGEQ